MTKREAIEKAARNLLAVPRTHNAWLDLRELAVALAMPDDECPRCQELEAQIRRYRLRHIWFDDALERLVQSVDDKP